MQKKDFTCKQHIAKFNNDSGETAKSILMKILECSLLGSVIVKHVGVFDQKNYIMMTDFEELSQHFKRLLLHIMKLNILAANY